MGEGDRGDPRTAVRSPPLPAPKELRPEPGVFLRLLDHADPCCDITTRRRPARDTTGYKLQRSGPFCFRGLTAGGCRFESRPPRHDWLDSLGNSRFCGVWFRALVALGRADERASSLPGAFGCKCSRSELLDGNSPARRRPVPPKRHLPARNCTPLHSDDSEVRVTPSSWAGFEPGGGGGSNPQSPVATTRSR